jgi:hypothetical protein
MDRQPRIMSVSLMDYLLPGFISLSRIIASHISVQHPHRPSPNPHLPSSRLPTIIKPQSTQTTCIYSYRKKPIQTSQAGTGRPLRNCPRRTACWGMILNGKQPPFLPTHLGSLPPSSFPIIYHLALSYPEWDRM